MLVACDIISFRPQHSHSGEAALNMIEALEASTCSMPGLDGLFDVYNTTPQLVL
jgi:hypothetical protein